MLCYICSLTTWRLICPQQKSSPNSMMMLPGKNSSMKVSFSRQSPTTRLLVETKPQRNHLSNSRTATNFGESGMKLNKSQLQIAASFSLGIVAGIFASTLKAPPLTIVAVAALTTFGILCLIGALIVEK